MSDRDLLNYLQLAVVSANKSQPLGRDRFLVLAGAAACEAGLLDVAARCRELILAVNRRHMIGRYESVPDALRDDDFQPLLKHLRQLCPPEQAEFLARENTPESAVDVSERETAAIADALLTKMDSAG